MLYYLLYHVLQRYFSPLNVFRYITVRTVYASLTAMFLALVFGPWLIRRLRELQIGQFIREEGPQEHKKKAGTPTMGGVLIVLSTLVPTLLWADLTNPFVLLVAVRAVGFCRHRIYRRLRESFASNAISDSPQEERSTFRSWSARSWAIALADPGDAQRLFDAVRVSVS